MDVGRYRLLDRIGSGGMAEVFEAVAVGEQGFERKVAIKRMRDHAGGAAAQRRFLDEARIASQLHHANIAAVVDYGTADGVPFQVLEYVDGQDAHELIARAAERGLAVPVEVALHIAAMVGHALLYAHDATGSDGKPLGIVHRDVTPGNVLVAWSGDVKLTDFGIAFALQRADKTHAGTTKGTPRFMAPEQLLAGETDRRTDLFALGCVLHALVTGASPLTHDDQLLRRGAGRELELSPGLPEDVRAIVARCTRYQRRDRYANAGEVTAAVAAALAKRDVIDPRARLLDWLRVLDPTAVAAPARPPARGKLDALLDIELVLAEANDAGRTFTAMANAHATTAWAMSAVAEPPETRVSRRPRWLIPAAIAACVIAVVVVVIATRHDPSPSPSPSPSPNPTPPAEVTDDEPDALKQWAAYHHKAAPDFDDWVRAHAAAASALFTWCETRPVPTVELVTWVEGHPDGTLDTYLASHDRAELATVVATHPGDYAGLLAWIRKYPQAASTLARRPHALGALARHLAPT